MSVHQPAPVPGRHRLPDGYRAPEEPAYPPRQHPSPEGFLDESSRSVDPRDDERTDMTARLGRTLTTVAVPERATAPRDGGRVCEDDRSPTNGSTAGPTPADEHLRAIFRVTPTPLLLLSPELEVREANSAAERLTGRSVDELRGLDACTLFSDGAAVRTEVERAGRGGGPVLEYPTTVVRADRSTRPVSMSIAVVVHPTGTSTDLVANLVERSSSRARPHTVEDSFSDPVTGLPSRPQFLEQLHDAVLTGHRHRTPTSVLILNVAGLSRLAGELGADAAERAAIELATTLRSGVRTGDSVASLGEEIFSVICRETDPDAATFVAERLSTATSGTISANGRTVILHATAQVFSVDGSALPSAAFNSLVGQADGCVVPSDAPARRKPWVSARYHRD